MKSLFLRIFLSFWMAQALFVVLAILVTVASRPRGSSWEALRTAALNDSVNAYEEGGAQKLRKYFENLDATSMSAAFYSMRKATSFRSAPRLNGPCVSPPDVRVDPRTVFCSRCRRYSATPELLLTARTVIRWCSALLRDQGSS